MLYQPNLAALESGDLKRAKAELDRVVLSLQGTEDQLWANTFDLTPTARRVCEDGVEAVRLSTDPEDFDDFVRRLAATVHCLNEIRKLRMTRDMAAAMLT